MPLLVAVVACAGEPGQPVADVVAAAQTPVILISIDTLRADRLPAYGYGGVETPALDRFRRDAMLFENAYSAAPTTLPSHVSLLTGLMPPVHGVRDNVGYRLDSDAFPTLADTLGAAGYATGAAVSAYVLRARTGLGPAFDHYDDGIEVTARGNLGLIQRPGRESAGVALQWIDEHRDRPFFFFLHLFEPHSPYEPPEPFRSRYADPYDGEIAVADEVVGGFLERLRQLDIYDQAVILVLSDHGEGLGDHGEAEHGVLLYREAIHVPLMLKLPGSRRAGAAIAEAAHLVDVVPTVLEQVGLPVPDRLPGDSLLALAEKPPEPSGRRLYSETYYPRLHLGWSELTSLVDDHHHFIEGPAPELFDIVADPGERHDILQNERQVARAMRRDLGEASGDLTVPEKETAQDAARLAALGYLTATVGAAGDLPDPRQALPAMAEVRTAYKEAGVGRHEVAVEILEPLVERYPGMLDARFQLALSLQLLGRDQEALDHYRRGIELAPAAADGMLIEIARILARQGRLDEALEHARAAQSNLPPEALELQAEIAFARDDGAEALDLVLQAIAAERVPRADSLMLLARMYLANDELESALGVLDGLRARVEAGRRPPVPGLEFERGEALARLGRHELAVAAFHEEIRRFPRNARAYAHLAVLYVATQQSAEVDDLLERMVAADPRRETFLLAAATVERLGNQAEAQRWRRRGEAVSDGP